MANYGNCHTKRPNQEQHQTPMVAGSRVATDEAFEIFTTALLVTLAALQFTGSTSLPHLTKTFLMTM